MRAEVYSPCGRSLMFLEWWAGASSLDNILLSGREPVCHQPRYTRYIFYHYICVAYWLNPEQINHKTGVNPIDFPSAAGIRPHIWEDSSSYNKWVHKFDHFVKSPFLMFTDKKGGCTEARWKPPFLCTDCNIW